MLRKMIDCTLKLDSLAHTDIDEETGDKIIYELLLIDGVNEVETYAEYIITCTPNGYTNTSVLKDMDRIVSAANVILNRYDAMNPEAQIINAKIEEACGHKIINGMVPAVYRANLSDGSTRIGFNFVPEGSPIGSRFHFDHGAGITRNEDAQILWMMK